MNEGFFKNQDQDEPPRQASQPRRTGIGGMDTQWQASARDAPGFDLASFVAFRQMITPGLITIIWILGFIGITITALALLSGGILTAVTVFIVGNLYLRVILELMIVLFRIYDRLGDIERRGRGM